MRFATQWHSNFQKYLEFRIIATHASWILSARVTRSLVRVVLSKGSFEISICNDRLPQIQSLCVRSGAYFKTISRLEVHSKRSPAFPFRSQTRQDRQGDRWPKEFRLYFCHCPLRHRLRSIDLSTCHRALFLSSQLSILRSTVLAEFINN